MEHFLGVHCSVSGGLENAFGEANGLHIDVMQVFTRNQRQWNAKPISDEERIAFQDTWKSSQIKVAFSHCSYLINLAAESDETREKSIAALILEVERCTLLGLSFCILHPGAAVGRQLDAPHAADGEAGEGHVHADAHALGIVGDQHQALSCLEGAALVEKVQHRRRDNRDERSAVIAIMCTPRRESASMMGAITLSGTLVRVSRSERERLNKPPL